jgi:hypothetical protein
MSEVFYSELDEKLSLKYENLVRSREYDDTEVLGI